MARVAGLLLAAAIACLACQASRSPSPLPAVPAEHRDRLCAALAAAEVGSEMLAEAAGHVERAELAEARALGDALRQSAQELNTALLRRGEWPPGDPLVLLLAALQANLDQTGLYLGWIVSDDLARVQADVESSAIQADATMTQARTGAARVGLDCGA